MRRGLARAHVARHARRARVEDVREARLGDLARDDLRGERELLEEPREVAGRAARLALHGEQVLLEGLTAEGGPGRAGRV